MGGKLSLTALHRSARFSLVGLADLRAETRAALAAEYPDLQTFETYPELFAAMQPEVVCVSTYAPSHEEITLAALALPGLKGILVEKPLGADHASGRRILEAIAARGVPVAVPHGLLGIAASRALIETIRGGALGRLVLVEIQCRGWDILNAGIHWLHFCRMLAPDDKPITVHAAIDPSTRTYRDGIQVETAATVSIVQESGLRVVMHTGDETVVNVPGKGCWFRLLGERGWAEYGAWEGSYAINGVRNETPPFAQTGHQFHLEAMAAQIDGAPRDTTVAQASLEALELCEAAYLSGKYHRLLTLPLTTATLIEAETDWEPGQPYTGTGGGRDGRQFG
jgi:predicted dehydrogenase